jgi:hypothetical protein
MDRLPHEDFLFIRFTGVEPCVRANRLQRRTVLFILFHSFIFFRFV